MSWDDAANLAIFAADWIDVAGIPDPITDAAVKAGTLTTSGFTIEWTLPAGGSPRDAIHKWQKLSDLDGNLGTDTDLNDIGANTVENPTGGAAGRLYETHYDAKNASGSAPGNPVTVAILNNPIQIVDAGATTSDSVTVTCSAVGGGALDLYFNRVEVYHRVTGQTPWLGPEVQQRNGNATQDVTVSGLTASTQYDFKANYRQLDSVLGADSTPIQVTTSGAAAGLAWHSDMVVGFANSVDDQTISLAALSPVPEIGNLIYIVGWNTNSNNRPPRGVKVNPAYAEVIFALTGWERGYELYCGYYDGTDTIVLDASGDAHTGNYSIYCFSAGSPSGRVTVHASNGTFVQAPVIESVPVDAAGISGASWGVGAAGFSSIPGAPFDARTQNLGERLNQNMTLDTANQAGSIPLARYESTGAVAIATAINAEILDEDRSIPDPRVTDSNEGLSKSVLLDITGVQDGDFVCAIGHVSANDELTFSTDAPFLSEIAKLGISGSSTVMYAGTWSTGDPVTFSISNNQNVVLGAVIVIEGTAGTLTGVNTNDASQAGESDAAPNVDGLIAASYARSVAFVGGGWGQNDSVQNPPGQWEKIIEFGRPSAPTQRCVMYMRRLPFGGHTEAAAGTTASGGANWTLINALWPLS